jgi:hypothetical protein
MIRNPFHVFVSMFSCRNMPLRMVLCLSMFLSACNLPVTPTPILDDPIRVFEYYVSTGGNDTNDCLSEATACRHVYAALTKSTPFGTIHIGPGEFPINNVLGIRHDITILGAGVDQTILTDESSDAIQAAYPARVVIRDLTIRGTDRLARGSGIEIRDGVQLTLENCHILGKYHGLQLFPGATATVRNCIFEDTYYGIGNSGDLTLTASILTENLLGLTNGGTALVEDTSFDGNGTFDSTSGASTTAVTNSGEGTLTMRGGNISNTIGYGLIVNGGSVSIESVAIHDNEGIAVWHHQGLLTVHSSVISDNGAYGVAIGGRSGVADIGRVNITQSAILRNGSSGVRIDGGEIHIQNTTISGNVATTSGGGGIWGYGGDLFLLDSTVAYNTGKGLELGPGGSLGPAAVITRRSVVALNSETECQLDPSTSFSASVFARFVCSESWTADTLKLRALSADGGTFVHPIDADSPLVNSAGPTSTCPGVDQRNAPRPSGSTCDVGAYEYGSASAALVIATPGTPEIIPLLIETPTLTPESTSFILVIQVPANCRQGPGVGYPVVNSALEGEQLEVIGKSADGSWWYSKVDNDQCFISNIAGTPSGDLNLLTVIQAPPTPVPTKTEVPQQDQPTAVPELDFDQDGYGVSMDCNDKNAAIHPGAVETPDDKVDSNCNGDDDQ